jgi:hypothetical protein
MDLILILRRKNMSVAFAPKVVVVQVSFERELKELNGKMMVESIIDCGGFLASDSTFDVVQNNPGVYTEEQIRNSTINGRLIVAYMSIDMAAKMSQQTIEALLLHEEGHILLGHVGHDVITPNSGVGLVLKCVLDEELAADAYSAAIVGKKCMRDALIMAMRVQSSAKKGNFFQKFWRFCKNFGHPYVQARLKALE